MSIEAMKQAMESAYLAGFYRSGEGYNSDYPFSNKGLDPLDDPYWIESRDAYVRTAIEQAEKQEPVAYKWKGELFTPNEIEMLDVDDAVPLYQNPEPVECMCGICKLGKREWVGLTEEEIKALYNKYATYQEYDAWESGWFEFAGALEAKLKEKNETP